MEHKTALLDPNVLDAEQEYAWAVEPSRPVYPMLAVETQGRFSREQWEKAYEAVWHRYPTLSGRIVKRAGERPELVLSPDKAPPFSYAAASGSQILLEAMKAEASHSFGLGASYLARLTILESPVSTYLLFSAHHAICDGYTNVSIVRDLLLAVNGRSIGPAFSILPSVGDLLGIGPPLAYKKTLDQPLRSDCGDSPFPTGQMETLRLEPEVFGPLLDRTRKEGATLQGVLVSALYLAGRQLNPSWQSVPVASLSPADLRPLLKLGLQPGVFLATLPTVFNPDDRREFWDLAKDTTVELQAARTLENARAGQLHLRTIFNREVDPCRRDSIDLSGFHHDLMVTNLGVLDDLLGIADLRISQAYQSVFSGTSDKSQIVSALTLHGVLFLHHASRDPIVGLLRAAEEKLVEALKGSV